MKQVTTKRERDKQVIEASVRRFGPISRVDIYKLTNLRRTTISMITRELLQEGRLVEVGRSNNPLGRKQILLKLNDEHRFIVGIEFDDKTVIAGVMNLHPEIKHIVSVPIDLSGSRNGLIQQLKSAITRVIQEAGVDASLLVGIGIADPGLIDSRKGVTITSTTIDFWNDVPLRKIFEEEFKVQVVVESKTRAKTVAERMLGAGGMEENLVYFDYGAGIGAGMIVDGRLLYGRNCGAGEIGHTRISEDGPSCKCGTVGCLEATAGTSAIEARVSKALAEGAGSQVLSLANDDPAKVTARLVLEAAKAGDKMCGNIVFELARDIGIAVANVVNLFNPAVVVFDRNLEPGGNILLEEISRVVRGHALTSSSADMPLRFGTIGEEAGILGIGLLVLEKHFEIPGLRLPNFMIDDTSFQRGHPIPVPASGTTRVHNL